MNPQLLIHHHQVSSLSLDLISSVAHPPPPVCALERLRGRVTSHKNNVKPPGEWWKVQPAATPEPAPSEPSPGVQPLEEIDEEQEVPLSDASTDELCLKASGGQNSWPATYGAAMKRSDAEAWQLAAQAEIDALIANGTWEACPLPPGKKAIGNRWVLDRKSTRLNSSHSGESRMPSSA